MKIKKLLKQIGTILMTLLMSIGVVSMVPINVEAAADIVNISIIPTNRAVDWQSFANAHTWFTGSPVKFNRVDKNGSRIIGFNMSLVHSWASSHYDITTAGAPAGLVDETFEVTGGTNPYAVCFDQSTAASTTSGNPRRIGDTLPSGFTLMTQAETLELAKMVNAIQNTNLVKDNISTIFAPSHASRATDMMNNSTYARKATFVLAQIMAWVESGTIQMNATGSTPAGTKYGTCNPTPSNYNWTANGYYDKEGVWHPGSGTRASFVASATPFCSIVNMQALTNLARAAANSEDPAVCVNATLEYGVAKTFTGKTAQGLINLNAEGNMPSYLTFANLGGGTVSLTSTDVTGRTVKLGTNSLPSGSFSSTIPYNAGSHSASNAGSGQLIVSAADAVPLCLNLNIEPGAAYIGVRKTDNAGNNLSGVKFGIFSSAAATIGTRLETITTGSNGQAVTSNATNYKPGTTYYVRELTTAEDSSQRSDIVVSSTIYNVTPSVSNTSASSPAYVNSGTALKNNQYAHIGINNKVDGGGNRLSGVHFGVFSNSSATGTPIQTLVTDASGRAVSTRTSNILVGRTYYVRELRVSENSNQRADIEISSTIYPVTPTSSNTTASSPAYINNGNSIVNIRPAYIGVSGKVLDDGGHPIIGVKFGVFGNAQATGTPLAVITTGAGGRGVNEKTDSIEVGKTYYVRELTQSEGQKPSIRPIDTIFRVSTTSAHTSPSSAVQITTEPIVNYRGFFSASFQKEMIGDSVPNEVKGESVFKVWTVSLLETTPANLVNPGSYIKTVSGDDITFVPENGIIRINNIPLGRYELREFSVNEDGRMELADEGARIVFQNITPNSSSVDIISNNTRDLALAKQNSNLEALGGSSIAGAPVNDFGFFNSERFGGIHVTKYALGSEFGLQGAYFRVQGGPDNINEVITTGSDGTVRLSPLKLGTYTVTEIVPPVGYLLSKNPVQTVEVKHAETLDDIQALTFYNELETFRFEFDKIDVEGMEYREDIFNYAVFEVTPVSLETANPYYEYYNDVVASDMTITNSVAYLPSDVRLPTGRYKITEKSLSSNTLFDYRDTHSGEIIFEVMDHNGEIEVISNNTRSKAMEALSADKVALDGNAEAIADVRDMSFANKPNYGIMFINKTNSETDQPLDGAQFRVTNTEWEYDRVYTTDDNGHIQTEPLRVGEYTVEEILPPTAHAYGEETIQTVTITKSDVLEDGQTLNFSNAPQTFGFDFVKKNYLGNVGNYSMEGAEFELKVVELVREGISNQVQPGELVGTYTTDHNGEFSIDGLPVGIYELTEIKAPDNYVLNSNPVRISAQWDSAGQLVQEVVSFDYGMNEIAVDNKIETMRNKLNIVQNSLLPEEEIGTLDITYAKAGLIKDFEEEADKLTFAEIPMMGRFEIGKHEEWNPELESETKTDEWGIIFNVIDNSTNQVVDTLVTNHFGKAASKYLPVGTYTVKQMNKGEKDLKLVPDFEVEITSDGQVFHYQIENAQARMRLRLIKEDEHTGQTIIQEGVEFQIYNAADDSLVKMISFVPTMHEVDRLVTGPEGYADTVEKLPAGDYYLKEIKGPEGYFFDEEQEFPFTIPVETNQDDSIKIIEIVIGNRSEEMVEETVTNLPQYGELTIHKKGNLFTQWIEKIMSIGQQTDSSVETIEVVTPQSNVALTLKSVIEVEVEKQVEVGKDEEGNPIYNLVKELIPQETQETIYTDDSGKFSRIMGVGTYDILDKDNNSIKNLVVEDGELSLEVQLPDIVTSEEKYVEGEVIDVDYLINQAEYAKGYLTGAKFQLIALEDINSYDKQTELYKEGDTLYFAKEDIVVDEKVIYQKGDVISAPIIDVESDEYKDLVQDYVETTADEPVLATRVPLGKYELVEIEAPLGYKKDLTYREYEFTPQHHTIKVELQETDEIINERQILTIQLDKKVIEETEYFGRLGFDNIVFGLYTNEEILGLEKDTLVYVVSPDEDGKMTVSDIPSGSYYFKELSTKNGYVLNENEYDVSVSHVKDLDEDVVEIEETEVPNEPDTGKLVVIKVDVINGEKLEGVEFKLWAVLDDGTKLPVMNGDSDIWTTGADGSVQVEELPHGNYEWEEVKPINGYIDEKTTVNVAVSDDAKMEVIIGNSPSEMSFRKYDKRTGQPIVGAILGLFDIDGNVVKIGENGYVNSNGIDAIWETDGSKFVVRGLTVGATYELREIQAADGYVRGDSVMFVVENNLGLQLTSIENEMTQASVIKVDWSSGEYVHGAELAIVDVETGNIFIDKITGQPVIWTTGAGLEDGFVVNGLVVGKEYAIVELKTPEGYLPPLEDLIIVLENSNLVQEFKLNNEPIPEIKTQAKFDTDVKESLPEEDVTVIDTVAYDKVVIGQNYIIKGQLVDVETLEVIATSEFSFLASETSGTAELEFKFDASVHEGRKLVVFEDLYRVLEPGVERHVGSHREPLDLNQTVYIPSIGTSATDKEDGRKDVSYSESQVIRDVITYTNLNVGQIYKVVGTLMDKITNSPLLADGKEVVVEKTFTAETANGTVTIDFPINVKGLEGKTLVVFEKIYNGVTLIAKHEDINDEDQTMYIPYVRTQASDVVDGGKHVNPFELVTIIDSVMYENLIAGNEYMVRGKLMNKITGQELETYEFEDVYFTADSASGSVEVEFTINPEDYPQGLEGMTLVVFEELYAVGDSLKLVAEHKDFDDLEQTILIPSVKTTAKDSEDGANDAIATEEVTIVDEVHYENLIPGKEYTIKGILMDKETGLALEVDGKEVVSELTFTPTEPNGSVELSFTFDSSALAGKTIVVFESLYTDDKLIGKHHDIEDAAQTIEFPEVGTSAEFDDENKVSNPKEITKLVDKVEYNNLIVGETYTVKGILMDKETGQELLINNETVKSELTFIAETKDGFVELVFEFDSRAIAGKEIVVFEQVFNSNGKLVASHEDINDENQTVKFTEPSVATTATIDGEKSAPAAEDMSITDTVKYTGLVVGKTYTLEGILMDKETGQPILIDGKPVTASLVFVAETEDGEVSLDFVFDSIEFRGKKLVVFEKLYEGEGEDKQLIASHEDINDEGQTVLLLDPLSSDGGGFDDGFSTSDDSTIVSSFTGLISILGASILFFIKKRKEQTV